MSSVPNVSMNEESSVDPPVEEKVKARATVRLDRHPYTRCGGEIV